MKINSREQSGPIDGDVLVAITGGAGWTRVDGFEAVTAKLNGKAVQEIGRYLNLWGEEQRAFAVWKRNPIDWLLGRNKVPPGGPPRSDLAGDLDVRMRFEAVPRALHHPAATTQA
jgi:hypothetical protein